jgi:hypothetical protein
LDDDETESEEDDGTGLLSSSLVITSSEIGSGNNETPANKTSQIPIKLPLSVSSLSPSCSPVPSSSSPTSSSTTPSSTTSSSSSGVKVYRIPIWERYKKPLGLSGGSLPYKYEGTNLSGTFPSSSSSKEAGLKTNDEDPSVGKAAGNGIGGSGGSNNKPYFHKRGESLERQSSTKVSTQKFKGNQKSFHYRSGSATVSRDKANAPQTTNIEINPFKTKHSLSSHNYIRSYNGGGVDSTVSNIRASLRTPSPTPPSSPTSVTNTTTSPQNTPKSRASTYATRTAPQSAGPIISRMQTSLKLNIDNDGNNNGNSHVTLTSANSKKYHGRAMSSPTYLSQNSNNGGGNGNTAISASATPVYRNYLLTAHPKN